MSTMLLACPCPTVFPSISICLWLYTQGFQTETEKALSLAFCQEVLLSEREVPALVCLWWARLRLAPLPGLHIIIFVAIVYLVA